MPSPLLALRLQLLTLVERLGAEPAPSRRSQRALERLLAARLDGHDGDPYDLAARVAEVLAFVEDGVEPGSYELGALAWVAARAAERLAEVPAVPEERQPPGRAEPALASGSPTLEANVHAGPLRTDPIVQLAQRLLGASEARAGAGGGV